MGREGTSLSRNRTVTTPDAVDRRDRGWVDDSVIKTFEGSCCLWPSPVAVVVC